VTASDIPRKEDDDDTQSQNSREKHALTRKRFNETVASADPPLAHLLSYTRF